MKGKVIEIYGVNAIVFMMIDRREIVLSREEGRKIGLRKVYHERMSDIVLPLGILRSGWNEKMKNNPGINTALYQKAVFMPG